MNKAETIDVTPWKIVGGKVNVPAKDLKDMRFDVFQRASDLLVEAGIDRDDKINNVRVLANDNEEKSLP